MSRRHVIALATIRLALKGHRAPALELPRKSGQRAAVALIFGGPPTDLSLCFIHRATRDGDPWSGHMAFPGGRASGQDPTPRAAAERETFEEIGLRLAEAEYLGSLSELRIRRHGVETGGVLSPFAFYAGSESPRLETNEEVAAAYWIPLRYLWSPENCTTIEFEREGATAAYPGIRHADQVIWGITYWILESFAEVISLPLPCNPGNPIAI